MRHPGIEPAANRANLGRRGLFAPTTATRTIASGTRLGRVSTAADTASPAPSGAHVDGRDGEHPRKDPPGRHRHVAHRLQRVKDEERTEGEEHRRDHAGDRSVHTCAEDIGEPDGEAAEHRDDVVDGRWTGNLERERHRKRQTWRINRNDRAWDWREPVSQRNGRGAKHRLDRRQWIGRHELASAQSDAWLT